MTTVPPALVITFFAAFGLIVGSFLNVCIYRLPLKQSIVWPASRCAKCQRELSWFWLHLVLLSIHALRH